MKPLYFLFFLSSFLLQRNDLVYEKDNLRIEVVIDKGGKNLVYGKRSVLTFFLKNVNPGSLHIIGLGLRPLPEHYPNKVRLEITPDAKSNYEKDELKMTISLPANGKRRIHTFYIPITRE
ncbi:MULTISPECIES: hypothetical protein [unclassified Flavobacterium]|uniref:hypothetical protein n=1 Tax=unclassified Flavobacterium TaxID=196869 RepID=UPI001F141837|nr:MULTISPECIES: hypothetical protein [unclassified Flavobacterium]UMY65289.1 hypothetical protein MKO97_12365 [Flavobacterium sp. HJ-32-4]